MLVSDQGTGFHGYMKSTFLAFRLVYSLIDQVPTMLSTLYREQKDEWHLWLRDSQGGRKLYKLGLSCKVIGAGGSVSICNVNVSRLCWPVGTDEVKFTVRTRISLASACSPRALTLSQLCPWIPGVSLRLCGSAPGAVSVPTLLLDLAFSATSILLKGLPANPPQAPENGCHLPRHLVSKARKQRASLSILGFHFVTWAGSSMTVLLCLTRSFGFCPPHLFLKNLGINLWGLVHGQSLW